MDQALFDHDSRDQRHRLLFPIPWLYAGHRRGRSVSGGVDVRDPGTVPVSLPALNALAPTQSEPPFQIAQLAALLLFVGLGIQATMSFMSSHRAWRRPKWRRP